MKTKKHLYLFLATLLFLSVFFVGIYTTSASFDNACYDECMSNSSMGDGECTNFCTTTTPDTPDELVCEYGYKEDPNDPNSCIPTDACPLGFALVNGDCVDEQNQSSQCDYGYTWNGSYCAANDSCPDGTALVNGQCQDTSGGAVSSTCDPSPSCWFYNCCSSPSTDNTPNAQTPEEIAAAKKAANEAQTKAIAATKAQNAAANIVNTKTAEMERVCSSGATQSPECLAAQKALNDAKNAFDQATAAARAEIENANAFSGATGASANVGAGYVLCANGILATVCEGGGGTPYVAGYSTSSFGSGLGSYGNGSSGITTPKCGNGFQDVGGVCFPMTTGLSNAPITTILGNIFSWMMMLFTTLAIIAFVVSGIQYFMASGDESMAEKAKENATHAVIGIIVGLSGFIIIKAIAAALSGQSMFF